jgi:hypothetical protein
VVRREPPVRIDPSGKTRAPRQLGMRDSRRPIAAGESLMRALGVVVVVKRWETLPGRLQRSRQLPLAVFILQRAMQSLDKGVQIWATGRIDHRLDPERIPEAQEGRGKVA